MSIPPSHPIRRKFLPVSFIAMGTLAVVVAVLAFGRTGVVNANSSDLNLFDGKYPKVVGSKIDSCDLCHTSSIPALNSYGAAL